MKNVLSAATLGLGLLAFASVLPHELRAGPGAGAADAPGATSQVSPGGPDLKQPPADKRLKGLDREGKVDPAKTPDWKAPTAATLESAAADQRPILVYFANEKTTVWTVYDTELADMSKKSVVFIKIPHNADRSNVPGRAETIVPVSKLLTDNPALAYNIPVGEAKAALCDWHGNEYFRLDGDFKASDLERKVKEIAEKAETQSKTLQKNLDAAKQAWGKKNRAGALKAILRNFKEGVVGFAAQVESIQLYQEIVDAARVEIRALLEGRDKAGLEKLAEELKGTDAEKEVKEAIESLN